MRRGERREREPAAGRKPAGSGARAAITIGRATRHSGAWRGQSGRRHMEKARPLRLRAAGLPFRAGDAASSARNASLGFGNVVHPGRQHCCENTGRFPVITLGGHLPEG